MKKKILEVYITEEDFPMLFKMDKNYIGEICYDLLKSGYDNYFPPNKEILNPNMVNKIDKVSDILEELIGINKHSTKKGQLSENVIYQAIKNRHHNYVLEETRKKPHSGDGILNIPIGDKNNTKVMIEIKNYANVVNKDEIDKLKFDMKYSNINYAIMISMKSGFIGKKQMSIEDFLYNQKQYTIIYLPNLFGQIDKIDACFILLEKLIKFNSNNYKNSTKKLKESITEHLGDINTIFDDLNNTRQKYLIMESDIKKSLNNYYLDMRANENNIKNKINNIWKSIDEEFEYNDKDTIKNKMIKLSEESKLDKKMKDIFELFLNNNYSISTTIKNKLWTIIKDTEVKMTITKNNKDLEFKRGDKLLKVSLLCNQVNFKKILIKIEKNIIID